MILLNLCLELDDDCRLVVMERDKMSVEYKKVYDGKNADFDYNYTDFYFDKILLIKPQGDAIKVLTQKRSMLEAILEDD